MSRLAVAANGTAEVRVAVDHNLLDLPHAVRLLRVEGLGSAEG